MRRREFITGLAGAAALWPLSALAQQQGGMRRIGFLCSGLASEAFGNNIIAAFTQGLGALGWRVDVTCASTGAGTAPTPCSRNTKRRN